MHEEVQQLVVFGMSLHRGVVVSSLAITAALVLLALLVTRNMKERPSGVQSAMEYAYEYLVGVIESSVPEGARGCAPVVITLFLFILFSNLIGVIPWFESPTADVNVPVGLALVVFAMMIYYGVKSKGFLGYLKSFIRPNVLFLPINLIETFTKPITLAFRLFGNIFAGELLILILVKLIPIGVPTAFSLFHIFIGVIQAYLFFMLSLAYIAVAYEE
jgi:F-type H+-transporting ATPase subunit a